MANREVPGVRKIRRGEANPDRAYKSRSRKSQARGSRTGDGYSSNRGNLRDRFLINVNMSQTTNNMRKAKTIIGSQLDQVLDAFAFFEEERTASVQGTGKNGIWSSRVIMDNSLKGGSRNKFNIRSPLPFENMPLNEVDAFLRDVGKIGVSEIRGGIRNPENRPLSPRYDTGLMHKSVDYKIRPRTDGAMVEIGWTRRFNRYFGYQEMGVPQSGIGAMNAITGGYRRTAPKAYSLFYRFLNNYSKTSGFSGKYKK